jgi:uncharacterized protein (TIGR02444 family)
MQQGLWDFAVALYARPAIAALCLRAQDEHGADVCLLLTALWLEQHRRPFEQDVADALWRIAADWQQQVCLPLRQLRRAWKTPATTDQALATLRQQLAALEVSAEQALLERLQAHLEAAAPACGNPHPGSVPDWLQAWLPGEAAPLAGALRAALRQS